MWHLVSSDRATGYETLHLRRGAETISYVPEQDILTCVYDFLPVWTPPSHVRVYVDVDVEARRLTVRRNGATRVYDLASYIQYRGRHTCNVF